MKTNKIYITFFALTLLISCFAFTKTSQVSRLILPYKEGDVFLDKWKFSKIFMLDEKEIIIKISTLDRKKDIIVHLSKRDEKLMCYERSLSFNIKYELSNLQSDGQTPPDVEEVMNFLVNLIKNNDKEKVLLQDTKGVSLVGENILIDLMGFSILMTPNEFYTILAFLLLTFFFLLGGFFLFRGEQSIKMSQSCYQPLSFVLIIVILFFAFVLRAININRFVESDELMHLICANSNLKNIFFCSPGIPSVSFNYFLHFLYKIDNILFLRAVQIFLGVLSIFFTFLLGKSISGYGVGLLSAFLLSVNIVHIDWSQSLRGYIFFTLFSVMSAYFFYLGVKNDDSFSFLIFAFSTVVVLYYSPLGIFLIFAIFIFSTFSFFKERKGIKRKLIISFVLIGISTILFVPVFLRSSATLKDPSSLSTPTQTINNILKSFNSNIIIFLTILILLIINNNFRKSKDAFFISSLLLIPFVLFIAISPFKPVHERYFVFLTPFYPLLFSYSLVSALKNFSWKNKCGFKTHRFTLILIPMVCGLVLYQTFAISFLALTKFIKHTDTKDIKKIVKYLDQHATKEEEIYILPGLDIFKFIFYFYGKEDINYPKLNYKMEGHFSSVKYKRLYGGDEKYIRSLLEKIPAGERRFLVQRTDKYLQKQVVSNDCYEVLKVENYILYECYK